MRHLGVIIHLCLSFFLPINVGISIVVIAVMMMKIYFPQRIHKTFFLSENLITMSNITCDLIGYDCVICDILAFRVNR